MKKFAAEGKRKEAFALAAELWATTSEKEKAPYIKLAEEDKKRFDRQVEELKKKGYYTLEDGSKSTDPANASLLQRKKSKATAEETDAEPVL